MELIEHISLTLQPPKHGWLPLRLQLNDFVIDDSVSNVLNDPLGDLIGAVELCLAPAGARHRACLWLEPDGYAVDLTPGTSADRCLVRVSYDDNFVPPMWGCDLKEVSFEGQAEARLIADALFPPIAQLVGQMNPVTLKWWMRLDSSPYADRIAAIQSLKARAVRR